MNLFTITSKHTKCKLEAMHALNLARKVLDDRHTKKVVIIYETLFYINMPNGLFLYLSE